MGIIHQETEWENDKVRLVKLTGLTRHTNFPFNHRSSARYREIQSRKVEKIFVHQTAGSKRRGLDAAARLSEWITRNPKYGQRKGKGKMVRIGGGRGFPGAPYTFLVPYVPDVQGGRFVVYRLWDDDWVTWHTKGNNRVGVGVAFAGSFRTRHQNKFSDHSPHETAMLAGTTLIEKYLLPRYDLKPADVSGHFETGKPTCPGDDLEAWVRRLRGEKIRWLDEDKKFDSRPLYNHEQKILAFVELGFDREGAELDCREGFRMAVECVQDESEIVVDGIWGPQTERAVRLLLTE